MIRRGDPHELLYIPIAVSMDPPDCAWSERICVQLAGHHDFNVRGNAVLGFGHLARTCGYLAESVVRPIIEKALHDPHEYVRGQAVSATDDIEHFLGWRVFRG